MIISTETLCGEICAEAVMTGNITPYAMLEGGMYAEYSLSGSAVIPVYYEDYDGTYVVIPSFAEQTLSTEDKHLNEDVRVESIPYSEVSNPTGGITINIGG